MDFQDFIATIVIASILVFYVLGLINLALWRGSISRKPPLITRLLTWIHFGGLILTPALAMAGIWWLSGSALALFGSGPLIALIAAVVFILLVTGSLYLISRKAGGSPRFKKGALNAGIAVWLGFPLFTGAYKIFFPSPHLFYHPAGTYRLEVSDSISGTVTQKLYKTGNYWPVAIFSTDDTSNWTGEITWYKNGARSAWKIFHELGPADLKDPDSPAEKLEGETPFAHDFDGHQYQFRLLRDFGHASGTIKVMKDGLELLTEKVAVSYPSPLAKLSCEGSSCRALFYGNWYDGSTSHPSGPLELKIRLDSRETELKPYEGNEI